MGPDPQETVGLITFTKEILNGKLHILCSVFKDSSFSKKTSLVEFWRPEHHMNGKYKARSIRLSTGKTSLMKKIIPKTFNSKIQCLK